MKEITPDDVVETQIDEAIEEKHMSRYLHYLDFLKGARCGYHPNRPTAVRMALTWDTTTCPACRLLKRADEPETQEIDTRGD